MIPDDRKRLDLVDIGANLTHASFDQDREDVLARARAAGVVQLVVTGSSVAESRAAARLAAAHPAALSATAGIHPHHARELDEHSIPALRELAREPAIVAIGECGLDWYRNFSSHEEQERAFVAQLELASELRLPVFLHQRDAHARFVAILREHRPRLVRAVAHCFTGTAAELADCLELDLHVGMTGWICDERRGAHLRELVKTIPADRLMLETDAPYLLPRDLSPKPSSRRNEPMFLAHVAKVVAECRGESVIELARSTSATARRFFELPGPALPA